MSAKDEAAERLIDWSFSIDDYVLEVIRFFAEDEERDDEPIKLLEVSTDTLAVGRVDAFGFSGGGDVPYDHIIGIVTPEEWTQIQGGAIDLPEGWEMARSKGYKRELRGAGGS